MASTTTSSPSTSTTSGPTPTNLRPVVISGPSGTGKSTLLKRLFDEYPSTFGFSVSHTTRAPRSGEENGKAYHFVTRDEFLRLVGENAFIEHAEFSKNLYGTSIQAVKDVAGQGKRCILDIDSQGVKLIKANHPDLNPIYIFLSPPSLAALKARLTGRGTESAETLKNRLAASTAEIEYARRPGSYDAVVVNDEIDAAYDRLRRAVVEDAWSEIGTTIPEMREDDDAAP